MSVKIIKILDNTAIIAQNLITLADTKVLAGVPSDKAGRKETEGQPINNATLMYIHEHGAPEANIPARPVLRPAIKSIQGEIPKLMKTAAKEGMNGNTTGMMRALNAVGILAQNAMRRRITEGPFVSLSERTLAARRARGRTSDKPLIDTGQLRRALTYVIRGQGSLGKPQEYGSNGNSSQSARGSRGSQWETEAAEEAPEAAEAGEAAAGGAAEGVEAVASLAAL